MSVPSVSTASLPIPPKSRCSHPLDTPTIQEAAGFLKQRLVELDVETLGFGGDYFSGYFRSYQQRLSGVLQKQSWLLARSLDTHVPLEEQVLVDHGGGVGVFSMLAKAVGVGHVIYSDIKPESCEDACRLAEAAGLVADDYVAGDTTELTEAVTRNNLLVTAVASSNVIEHIYDFKDFASQLWALTGPSARVVLATSANNANPRIRRRYMRLQQKLEWRGRGQRETRRGYRDIRMDIIREAGHAFTDDEIASLADRTRGLAGPDLANAISGFADTGSRPQAISHPTNTCCPRTGNWTERLRGADEWANDLKDVGFDVKLHSGIYSSQPGHGWTNALRHTANLAIRCLGRHALTFSPFLALTASKTHSLNR